MYRRLFEFLLEFGDCCFDLLHDLADRVRRKGIVEVGQLEQVKVAAATACAAEVEISRPSDGVIAAILFIPVLVEYFHTGLVARFPTLIVCGFLVLAALQAFWSGLILSTIEQKNRSDFESQLKSASDRLKDLRNRNGAK